MGATLRICVLACSKGAEVYSILWTIRSARPDLDVRMQAIDISPEVLDFARRGVYSLKDSEFVDIPVFGRTTEEEMGKMFHLEDNRAGIRPELKDGITWQLADAADAALIDKLGPQDLVVANNFLCHMAAADAEKCLRNLSRLARPGGYLVVSGVDLDVRTKIAQELLWQPTADLVEEIHEGDAYLRDGWPWKYWGLEPFSKSKRDWQVRYATVFRVAAQTSAKQLDRPAEKQLGSREKPTLGGVLSREGHLRQNGCCN